jgi:hypothetical protein
MCSKRLRGQSAPSSSFSLTNSPASDAAPTFPLVPSLPHDHSSLVFDIRVLLNNNVLRLDSLSSALHVPSKVVRHWLNERLTDKKTAVMDQAIREYCTSGSQQLVQFSRSNKKAKLNDEVKSLSVSEYSDLPNADNPPVTDSEQEFELEKVLDRKNSRAGVFYLIKWKGFDSRWNSWEPAEEVGKIHLVREFERKLRKNEQKNEKRKNQKQTPKTELHEDSASCGSIEEISGSENTSKQTILLIGDDCLPLAITLAPSLSALYSEIICCPSPADRSFSVEPAVSPLLDASKLLIRWDVTPKTLRSTLPSSSLDCILLAVDNSHVEEDYFFRLISGFLRSVSEILRSRAEFRMCCSKPVNPTTCAAACQSFGFSLSLCQAPQLVLSEPILKHSRLQRFQLGTLYLFSRAHSESSQVNQSNV